MYMTLFHMGASVIVCFCMIVGCLIEVNHGVKSAIGGSLAGAAGGILVVLVYWKILIVLFRWRTPFPPCLHCGQPYDYTQKHTKCENAFLVTCGCGAKYECEFSGFLNKRFDEILLSGEIRPYLWHR